MQRAGAQNLRNLSPDSDPVRLLQTLDCLRAVITIFDPQGRLVYASAHLNHVFHKLPRNEELIGKSYEQLIRLELPEIAVESLAGGADAFIARRLTQLKQNAWAPQDIALADGRTMEVKARRDKDGFVILLWNDVTEARLQFARLEEAIKLSADAFAFFDARDCFVTGNELYAQLANAPLASLKGQSCEAIVTRAAESGHVTPGVSTAEWVARRMRGHRTQTAAMTLETADGHAYLVRSRATADGGRAVVYTDITEKIRAENALAQAQEQLEDTRNAARNQTGYLADLTKRLDSATTQADNAKTMLLRTMSHELKTPLNAVLGFSDLMVALADNLTPEQVREYAGLVHLGGTNLLKMVNQIMDLTKISAGRYDLRRAPVDAGSLLWLARDSFTAHAEAKDIVIDADACPIGLMIEGDETVFGNMLNALIDNAVTFTQKGGLIKLSAVHEGGEIRITVADNGPGVAANDLNRILQPFEHAGAVADHAQGAGLGLTLVKAFAELHGGRLEIESVSGEGFTATIAVPALI